MKKIVLSIIIAFVSKMIIAQVPQGFNYQAIARDGSSNPIANATIKVMLSILSDTTGFYLTGGGTYIWEEEQMNVKTNAFGLFTVVFGNPSATYVQGSADSFSAIDWAKTPLYIGTKIANPTDYKNLGTAKLWSVPYSMVTDSTKALIKGKRLSVVSSDDGATDALFEVKRKDGQTVFAVYPDAVNIYIPRSLTKSGTKGGFAIGSFDSGLKSNPTQDYFRVTPDSVRIYIDKTPVVAKGATKGGFAIGGFDQAKGWTHDLLTVSKDSVRIYINKTPTIAKGTTKGGFAIGGYDEGKGVTQDLLTVGNDSIRMYINDVSGKSSTKGGFAIGGFDQGKEVRANFLNVATEATGIINPSQNRILWYPIKNAFLAGKVLIQKPDSVGVNSFASGYESKAIGSWSQALGYMPAARGDYSTAIGKYATANGFNSYAFGNSAKALKDDSYSFGAGAIARGNGSFAFGSAGRDSTGLTGIMTMAAGDNSFALGLGCQSTGSGSFTLGANNIASGSLSYAIGQGAIASGPVSFAIGYNCQATAYNSYAFGYMAQANAYGAYAIGFNNLASGYASYSLGFIAHAEGNYSTAIGFYTRAAGSVSTAMGYETQAFGTTSTSMGESTIASGDNSTSMGEGTTAQARNSLVLGRYNSIYGDKTNWVENDPIFVIGNGSSDANRSNAITILKNGNVGIGWSTSPTARLEVNMKNSQDWSGNLKALRIFSPDINYYLDMNTFIISTGNVGYHFSPNLNTGLTISTPGYVGIGTTSPNSRLDVRGPITGDNNFSEPGNTGTTDVAGDKLVMFESGAWRASIGMSNVGPYLQGTGGGSGDGIRFVTGASSATERMRITRDGYVGIGTASPAMTLQIESPGNNLRLSRSGAGYCDLWIRADGYLGVATSSLSGAYCTGTVWQNSSDKNLKENFEELDSSLILEQIIRLPIDKWNYKNEDPLIKHIGPVSQDFYRIFELGNDDKSISTIDPAGIALVAIKELYRQNQEQKKEIETGKQEIQILKTQNESLQSRLELLQNRIEQIEAFISK